MSEVIPVAWRIVILFLTPYILHVDIHHVFVRSRPLSRQFDLGLLQLTSLPIAVRNESTTNQYRVPLVQLPKPHTTNLLQRLLQITFHYSCIPPFAVLISTVFTTTISACTAESNQPPSAGVRSRCSDLPRSCPRGSLYTARSGELTESPCLYIVGA